MLTFQAYMYLHNRLRYEKTFPKSLVLMLPLFFLFKKKEEKQLSMFSHRT